MPSNTLKTRLKPKEMKFIKCPKLQGDLRIDVREQDGKHQDLTDLE
jgi:hypothetical protein